MYKKEVPNLSVNCDCECEPALLELMASDRWLGATSVHSRDFGGAALNAMHLLVAQYPQLSIIVNHFDPGGQPALWTDDVQSDRITTTWIPDMKVRGTPPLQNAASEASHRIN